MMYLLESFISTLLNAGQDGLTIQMRKQCKNVFSKSSGQDIHVSSNLQRD